MSHAFWNAVRQYAGLLRRRRALRHVVELARQPLEPENDDRLMAFWAVLSRTGLRDRQGELLDAGRRFARRMERDPERQAAWSYMRLRLEALEGSLDAHAHFERISGHRVEPVEHVLGRVDFRQRALPAPAGSRNPVPGRATAAILIAWMGLFIATNITISDPFAFEPVGQSGYAWEQVGERTRGASTPSTGEEVVTYAAALLHAKSARYTWLGLFPAYNTATLMEARAMMVAAIEQANGGYSVPEQALRTLDIIDGLVAEHAP